MASPSEIPVVRGVRRTVGTWLHGTTLALSDVAALFVSAWLSFHLAEAISLRMGTDVFVAWDKAFLDRLPVAIPLLAGVLAWLHGRGRYSQRQPMWGEIRDLCAACLLGFVVEGFIQYAVKEHVSRLWIAVSWGIFPVLAITLRAWMKSSLTTLGVRRIPVLILGDDGTVRSAIEAEGSIGWHVVASLDMCDPEALLDNVARLGIRHVVVVGSPGPVVTSLMRCLSTHRISYALCLPVAGSGLASMTPTVMVGQDFLLMTERAGLSAPFARSVKRMSDVVIALGLLLASAPFALAVAIAIRMQGGAVLYGHGRVGRGGEEFRCLKFRSMSVDADRKLAELLASDAQARMEWEADRKLRKDPRVTALGQFLRTTGLDEIPQLWNILRGDMSFVGPRPVTREELGLYGEEVGAYLDVRPGLTGLWQASGRNDLGYARRVALDAWYVRNWSPWLDLVIILKTIPAVIARRGAY